jgi:Tropinone reductase 1
MAIGTDSGRWRLDGRRALVTGGTKGIGAAVVAELLGLGTQVTLVARAGSDVEQAVANARAAGHTAHGIAADITAAEAREAVVGYAVQAMGGIDILINNAGTNIRGASADFRPDDYAHVLNTNLTAAWEMCRVAYPHLRAAAATGGDACIVGIGSVAGATYIGSGAPYAMSKAALDHLTRYLAVEWAGDGVRVNGVNPWYTKTPLANRVLDDPAFSERVLKRTPLGRIADPEDISGIVAFLCLPVARHITGQTIAVDGGYLANGSF